MRTRTPYVATSTSSAPERGMGVQNWASNREWMEFDGEITDVEKSQQEGSFKLSHWIEISTLEEDANLYKRLNSENMTIAMSVKFLENKAKRGMCDKLGGI